MKTVALFTTFGEAKSGYSLVSVCETQIRMLLDHGYDPAVLVLDRFEEVDPPSLWSSSIIKLKKVVPFMHLTGGNAKDFEQRTQKILRGLEEGLEGVDVCIAHDIILQEYYKEHNAALRRYAKTRPDLLWLHWLHSCPSTVNGVSWPESLRHTSPPGYIVYPNSSHKGIVAKAYGLAGSEWKVIVSRTGHSIDPMLLWPYDGLTKALATKADLLGGDVVVVLPARLDKNKRPEKIIYLLNGVQKLGYEPRLLVIDWQSTGKRFQIYIDQLLTFAKSLGLEGKVNFTSRLDDRCSQGVPRRVVVELLDLSNIFILPSWTETYSLVVHEAILRGCLVVLNWDLRVMQELFGDNAIYMDFGASANDRVYEPSEQVFWEDEAKRLMTELMQNRALLAKTTARKEWTPQAMWGEFEPLLYKTPVGE